MSDQEEIFKKIRYYQEKLEKYSLNKSHDKLLNILQKLKHLEIRTVHLEKTGIGRTVNSLKKLGGAVNDVSKTIIETWKDIVRLEEEQKAQAESEEAAINECDHDDQNDDYQNQDGAASSPAEHDLSDHMSNKDYESESSHSEPDTKIKKKSKDKDDTHKDSHKRHKRKHESSKKDEPPTKKHKHSHSKDKHGEERSKSKDKDSRKHVDKHDKDKEDKKHNGKSHHDGKSRHDASAQRQDGNDGHHHKSTKKLDAGEGPSGVKHSDKNSKHESKSSAKKDHSDKKEGKDRSSHHHNGKKEHKHHSKKDKKISDQRSKSKPKVDTKSDSDSDQGSKMDERLLDIKPKLEHSSVQSEPPSKKKKKDARESEKHKSSSHKSENKPSKTKPASLDAKPVNKKKYSGEEGIDSGSGASFAEALGMCIPGNRAGPSNARTNSKKKTSSDSVREESPIAEKPGKSTSVNVYKEDSEEEPEKYVPVALKKPNVEPLDINISSLLPEITPNYRPLGFATMDTYQSLRRPSVTDDEALSRAMMNKNQRTKVYSGNKIFGKVESLFDLCVRVLQDNIDALEFTGGVPFSILRPVLQRATPDQLFNMEHHNPYIIEDTDDLWKKHCEKDFRTKKREEMETWREMYMRCLQEREARLSAITANIKQSQDKSIPVRQTKLAYVGSHAIVKPPRNVARKQAKNGTAVIAMTPAERVQKLSKPADAVKIPMTGSSRASTSSSSSSSKPKKAPLMAKALSSFKNRFRR